MIVIDAHCDAPSQMLRLRDYGIDNEFAQVDFPKMRRGGVDASFFAAYIPSNLNTEDAAHYASKLFDVLDAQVLANAATVAYAYCADDIRRNKVNGLSSILIGIENASPIGGDLSALTDYYKRGVRYVTLTHSADNQVGDSCSGVGTWGGLSPFGKDLVREMNKIGMLIDLAHASDNTMRDVLELTECPVLYTHGCCKALASHRRNISDELMRGIANTGGLVCISIFPCFLDDEFVSVLDKSGIESKYAGVEDAFIADPSNNVKRLAWRKVQEELISLDRPGVSRVADHIEHAVAVAGIEHVGIGTDYDGIEVSAKGLEDISRFGLLWEELRRRGFSHSEISLIAGENFLRVLG